MWKEVSEARYDEALRVLSPTIWLGKGFLMGESERYVAGFACSLTGQIGEEAGLGQQRAITLFSSLLLIPFSD
jgi:hypothetical protein